MEVIQLNQNKPVWTSLGWWFPQSRTDGVDPRDDPDSGSGSKR